MSGATLVLAALVLPAATAAIIPLFATRPDARETVTLVGTVLLFAAVAALTWRVIGGARPGVHLLEVLPGLSIAFAVEPLGALFAFVASSLWIVNSLFSVGYMRANREPRQTTFYVCFAGAITATMGIALAANLFTLFLFYEMLTLVTYPLVTHHRDEAARNAGRLYLLMLLGGSTLLLLPAIAWTGIVAGTLDFRPGGILGGALGPLALGVLLALFVFGIAKAAVMPMHYWLPAAMVAPTPVSALLHAVAVVKAGVFFITKVIIYVFGVDTLRETGAADWLIYVACATIILASLVALRQDHLKRRLAYSTISQLGYVVLGAALATSWGIVGSGMHIAMHAVGKITLFFCAGAIYTAAHKSYVSELSGLGRAMPFTFAFFLVGALTVIGLPPFGGAWSKWYLALGALQADRVVVVAVLMVSALLNAAYLLPIPFKAFFGSSGDAQPGDGPGEAPLSCLIATGATAVACVVLFFVPNAVLDLLRQIALQ